MTGPIVAVQPTAEGRPDGAAGLSRLAEGGAFRGAARRWLGTPADGVALLIVFTFLARLLFAGALGLGIDESYMVASGRQLRLGYFDHPPLAWWLAWAAAQLTGSESGIVVRLPFILLFAGTTWLMYRLTATLFGAWAGLWAAVLLNAAPVFGLTTGSWVLPDGPMMAALLGAAVCLVAALRRTAPAQARNAWGWWLGAGLCAGLALFSKYTAVLTIAGVIAYLLTERDGRRWLLRPHPYVAGLVSLSVFAPVLVWNATHGWTSLLFQAGRANTARFHPFGPLSALAGEAAFLLPWIWAPLVLCWGLALWRGPKDPARWLLVCLASPAILLFLVAAFKTRVLFHWAAPGYLMLFPLLGEAVGRRRQGSRLVRNYLRVTVALVVLGAGLVATEARFNWLPYLAGAFPLGTDPGLESLDWTSLRDDLAARGLLDRPGLIVATTGWQYAGKIDYALRGQVPVICLSTDQRQYGLLADRQAYDGADVVVVAPRTTLAQMRGLLGTSFDSLEELPPGMVTHAGRPALAVPLYLGRGLHRQI